MGGTTLAFGADGPAFSRYTSAENLIAADAPATLEKAMLEDWVVGALPADMRLRLWENIFRADGDARLLMGVSSEFVYLAVLSGGLVAETDAGDLQIDAGEAAVRRHLGGSRIRAHAFSARDLAARFDADGREKLAAALAPAVERQKRLRFWGMLRDADVNLGAPAEPGVEALRRSYLLTPPILSAKSEVATLEALPAQIAQDFLTYARDGDWRAMGALLSPSPFLEAARNNRFNQARGAFARTLLQQDWTKGPHSALTPGDTEWRFRFEAADGAYEIAMEPFDSGIFVSSVERRP